MYRILALVVLVGCLALSTAANAWFFIFLPGSVVQVVGDAITGSEGANCVGPNVKVGDIIRLSDGSFGTIKSLSGTSSGCKNPEHPIRALVEVSSNSASAVSSPINTKVGINLPDDWVSRPLSDAQKAAGYIFYAGNPKTNTVMALVVRKREGINDMGAFVTSRRATIGNSLKETQKSEVVSLTVNGLPAWRFDVTGAVNTGERYTYLHTFLDAGSEFLWINTWTPAAAFQEQRPTMEKLADGLTGYTPSKPVAVAPTLPTPANSNTPLATPASTTAPSEATASPNLMTAPAASPAQRLRELNGLYKEGLIDQKDYEEKKKKILDSI